MIWCKVFSEVSTNSAGARQKQQIRRARQKRAVHCGAENRRMAGTTGKNTAFQVMPLRSRPTYIGGSFEGYFSFQPLYSNPGSQKVHAYFIIPKCTESVPDSNQSLKSSGIAGESKFRIYSKTQGKVLAMIPWKNQKKVKYFQRTMIWMEALIRKGISKGNREK